MSPLRNYVISVKFDEEQDIHNSKVPPLKNVINYEGEINKFPRRNLEDTIFIK